MYGVSESKSGTHTPHSTINHDYNNLEKNNYTTRPPTSVETLMSLNGGRARCILIS